MGVLVWGSGFTVGFQSGYGEDLAGHSVYVGESYILDAESEALKPEATAAYNMGPVKALRHPVLSHVEHLLAKLCSSVRDSV